MKRALVAIIFLVAALVYIAFYLDLDKIENYQVTLPPTQNQSTMLPTVANIRTVISPTATPQIVTVMATTLYVRECASTKCQPVAVKYHGDRLVVAMYKKSTDPDCLGLWYRIPQGWVCGDWVK